jgi:hypothetical protein
MDFVRFEFMPNNGFSQHLIWRWVSLALPHAVNHALALAISANRTCQILAQSPTAAMASTFRRLSRGRNAWLRRAGGLLCLHAERKKDL